MDVLNYFANNATGLINIALSLLFFVALINYILWIFGLGRFKKFYTQKKINKDGTVETVEAESKKENMRYLMSTALVEIINDFRHLLALLIVLVFAFALAYALFRAGTNQNEMKDAFQVVTATLGGLVGSIIGYYFGESAAKSNETIVTTENSAQNEQEEKKGKEDTEDKKENIEAAPDILELIKESESENPEVENKNADDSVENENQ